VAPPELPVTLEFSITTASRNGAAIVSVSGELDITTAWQLEDAILACDGNKPVIVDITALTFIDSSGVHVLLGERSSHRPKALVVEPESHIARVLDIVSANQVLHLYPDLETAIKRSADTDKAHPRQTGSHPVGCRGE